MGRDRYVIMSSKNAYIIYYTCIHLHVLSLKYALKMVKFKFWHQSKNNSLCINYVTGSGVLL